MRVAEPLPVGEALLDTDGEALPLAVDDRVTLIVADEDAVAERLADKDEVADPVGVTLLLRDRV